jgi:hypothetical protein
MILVCTRGTTNQVGPTPENIVIETLEVVVIYASTWLSETGFLVWLVTVLVNVSNVLPMGNAHEKIIAPSAMKEPI